MHQMANMYSSILNLSAPVPQFLLTSMNENPGTTECFESEPSLWLSSVGCHGCTVELVSSRYSDDDYVPKLDA